MMQISKEQCYVKKDSHDNKGSCKYFIGYNDQKIGIISSIVCEVNGTVFF